MLQGFTNDPDALEQAIRKTTAGGSTSLYNAVYISLKELKKIRAKTEQDVRRQAIVVLIGRRGHVEPRDVRRGAGPGEAVGDGDLHDRAAVEGGDRAQGFKEADFVLRQLAQETGGRAFFPTRIEDLAGVYGQIADELASQYTLGYMSKNPKRDGAWRRIVVRVDREGATARTKQGYYGPTGNVRRMT